MALPEAGPEVEGSLPVSYGYASGNLESLRRTMTRAAEDLLQTEQLFQQMTSLPVPAASGPPEAFNVAFRASLKLNKMKLNEADVRKEFTYEYVSGVDSHPPEPAGSRKSLWPAPSLMREKSSAIQDLRARSESPSANKVLGESLPLQDPLQPEVRMAEAQVAKIRPPPPPKPGSGLTRPEVNHHVSLYENVEGQRASLAESLPESLAGFAATIISGDGTEAGSATPPIEPTVSPLISECDWMTNNTNASGSPLPVPDLMSLTSTIPELEATENLYVNTITPESLPASLSVSLPVPEEKWPEGPEDHYLPMTSAKLSFGGHPPLLPARTEFEENAYVEMGDSGRKQQTPLRQTSVFAGVLDQSYRSPESPRYSEISDCRMHQMHPHPEEEEEGGSHYEFLYKASGHVEPVYMEVPEAQPEAPEEAMQPEAPEAAERYPADSDSVGSSQYTTGSNRSSIQPPESTLPADAELDIIIPPRHPRFSISDTFRPASFFLAGRNLASRPLEPLPDGVEEQEAEPEGVASLPPMLEELHPSSAGGSLRLRRKQIQLPVPAPPASGGINHSRSQSLDTSDSGWIPPPFSGREGGGGGGRTSVSSYTSGASANSTGSGSIQDLNLSKRRPLTIVRSLEDLLIDSASDDQLPVLSLPAHPHHRTSASPIRMSPVRFGSGSTQSLTLSVTSGMVALPEFEPEAEQPVYENVTTGSGATCVNSNLSLNSTGSAPYYYSDLTSGTPLPVTPESAESTLTLRGCRTGRLSSMKNSPPALDGRQSTARATPPSGRNSGSGRAQTPDLLGHVRMETLAETPRHGGDVMRRVRSLEGLLDDPSAGSLPAAADQAEMFHPAAMSSGLPEVTTPVIKETPRYARDPTTPTGSEFRMKNPGIPEFSPWDEDKLWRDKLRRASIRHTRSMDMLDEIHHNRKAGRSQPEAVEEESGCYERLVQYSATLERAKRGQTYLDGYLWDELEQRFRRPESEILETSNHFLEDSLPPFEIDREKLRQWDLLSTAAPVKEGGRRPLGPAPNSEPPLTGTGSNGPEVTKREKSERNCPAAQPPGSEAYGQLTRPGGDVRLARQVQTRPPGATLGSSHLPEGDALIGPRHSSPAPHWVDSSPDRCYINRQFAPQGPSVEKMSPQQVDVAAPTAITPPSPPPTTPPPPPPTSGKTTPAPN